MLFCNTLISICSLGGKDALIHEVCKGAKCAQAKLTIRILHCPEIILIDSCSDNPKLTVVYQHANATYSWEHYDGTVWQVSTTDATTLEISAKTAGKYRLTVKYNGLVHKMPVGMDVIQNKKTTLPGEAVWYEMISIPTNNVW